LPALSKQVLATTQRLGYSWPDYEELYRAALANDETSLSEHLRQTFKAANRSDDPPPARPQKLAVKQSALTWLWESRQRTTRADWLDWMRRYYQKG